MNIPTDGEGGRAPSGRAGPLRFGHHAPAPPHRQRRAGTGDRPPPALVPYRGVRGLPLREVVRNGGEPGTVVVGARVRPCRNDHGPVHVPRVALESTPFSFEPSFPGRPASLSTLQPCTRMSRFAYAPAPPVSLDSREFSAFWAASSRRWSRFRARIPGALHPVRSDRPAPRGPCPRNTLYSRRRGGHGPLVISYLLSRWRMGGRPPKVAPRRPSAAAPLLDSLQSPPPGVFLRKTGFLPASVLGDGAVPPRRAIWGPSSSQRSDDLTAAIREPGVLFFYNSLRAACRSACGTPCQGRGMAAPPDPFFRPAPRCLPQRIGSLERDALSMAGAGSSSWSTRRSASADHDLPSPRQIGSFHERPPLDQGRTGGDGARDPAAMVNHDRVGVDHSCGGPLVDGFEKFPALTRASRR